MVDFLSFPFEFVFIYGTKKFFFFWHIFLLMVSVRLQLLPSLFLIRNCHRLCLRGMQSIYLGYAGDSCKKFSNNLLSDKPVINLIIRHC